MLNLIRYLNEEDIIKCGGSDKEFYLNIILDVFKLHAKGDFVQPLVVYLRRVDYTT